MARFFLSWEWRIDVIAVLLTFGTLYTIGWARLRHKHSKLATHWRLASYYAGLVVLTLALMSGVDTFQTQLLFIHMIQHKLLVIVAPPLLWWASPMPFILWAIPRTERQQIGRLLTQDSLFRRGLVRLTSPGMAWLIYSAFLWMWHDPNPYNAAIENDFLHDIEHITFFLGGMLIWWHITDALPKFHGRRTYAKRMALVVAVYFQNLFLGIGITMSPELIYTHYENMPRIWGISPMRDQQIGGLIMWIPGGMMYMIALLVLVAGAIGESEQRTQVGDIKRLQEVEK